MLTKESYKEFLQKIVDKHLPDESIVFEIQADEIIEDAFNNKYQSSESGHGEKFGAADLLSTKLVIELVVLSFTTYKTILDIIKHKREAKTVDLPKLQLDWESRMKKGGMKSARAKSIAEDFITELEKLVK